MKYLIRSIAFAAVLLGASHALAASRFAVCTTTCTWDGASTAMWSASPGGATGASVPGSGDTVTLDAATCVGGTTCTITVNTTVNVTSITMGACTASTSGCVLDFSANNNGVTLQTFSNSGTGTRTLNMGNGTWNITSNSFTVFDQTTPTNLTFNANSSTLQFTSTPGTSQRQFATGNKNFNVVVINEGASANHAAFIIAGTTTIATLTVTSTRWLAFSSGGGATITNGLTFNGSSGAPVILSYNATSGSNTTLTSANPFNLTFACIYNVTIAGGGSLTATNSFDCGGNTGSVSISPPSSGTGGKVIGG